MKKTLILIATLFAITAHGATTFTTNYNLSKPSDGDQSWGSLLRDDLDAIDAQMYINANGIANHIADTTDAHDATAISTITGTYCTLATDVQTFLSCLDTQIQTLSSTSVNSVFGRVGIVTAEAGDYTTTLVTEGNNLYFTEPRVLATMMTGFVSGAGTVADTDNVLQSIQKLDGNIALKEDAIGYTTENVANKATDFTTVNNTLYPTVEAVSEYVATLVPISEAYMLSNVDSDIATYESAPIQSLYTPGALTTITTAGVNTGGTLLATFATDSGYPDKTELPVGNIVAHFETQKASGSINYVTYFEVYKRDISNVETLILTSEESSATAANTKVQQTVNASVNTAITLLATDRLVFKFYAKTLSSTASIDFFYDNNSTARVVLPTYTLGYTPENKANKATDIISNQTSDTLYPSVKSVFDWGTAAFEPVLGFTPNQSIQFQDEGVAQGSSGAVTTVNFTGPGVVASESSNTLTVNITGSGGGGSLKWVEDENSPVFKTENNIEVYSFYPTLGQKLYALIKVPSTYDGSQIKLKVSPYSTDLSGTNIVKTVSTLIRSTDLISSTTNQYTNTQTITLGAGTVSEPQFVDMNLTDASGDINSVAVSAGDYIKVELSRDTSDTATGNMNVPVYGIEVSFN